MKLILAALTLAAAPAAAQTAGRAPTDIGGGASTPSGALASAPAASTETARPAAGVPAPSTAPLRAPGLRLLSPQEYPDFKDGFESKKGLIKAARKSLEYLEKGPVPKYFRVADREYAPAILADSIREFLEVLHTAVTEAEIAAQVRERFDVFQSVGSDGAGKVVFSSYYQPILPASRKKTPQYPFPLFRRPPDMVEADLGAFDKKWEGETLIGRVAKDAEGKNRLVPFFTRGDIDIRKVLANQGLEIAWLKDRFDRLDLHIQGSGILRFPEGSEMLAKFAATNAQPYSSVGLMLVRANIFTRDEISRDKLRDYVRANPQAADWIISQNPRYTFFDLVPLPPDGEPFGTTQQSLVPARSIAIDPAVIPLGAIAYFSTTSPQADAEGRLLGNLPNSRYSLCMDTGGAIKGPGRVDIYAGHGAQAAATARSQWSDGRLYILIKKLPPRER